MEWKKYTVEDSYLPVSGLLAIFLLFTSFYFQSLFLFFFAAIVLLLTYLNSLYLKHIGKRLYFENIKERKKFFPKEEGVLVLQFENNGLPIMKGNVKIVFDDIIAPIDGFGDKQFAKFEVNIPLSLNYNQKSIIKIPFTAQKRGLAKIWSIEINIPHFFGLGETVLHYKHLVMQEILVYPIPSSVKNLNSFLTSRPGESLVSHSLFEDFLSPSGTREYVYSDSFNRINWKASARMQSLQTKVFDRVAETGWTLSLNIANGHSILSELEELLSSATQIAYFSTKSNIPFSLCINVRKAGTVPFYYIPPGTGKEQLEKVLEVLALVKVSSYTIPYEKMLGFYYRHLAVQPYFIHGGKRSIREEQLFKLISNKGTGLLELQLTKEEAVIVQLPVMKDVVGK